MKYPSLLWPIGSRKQWWLRGWSEKVEPIFHSDSYGYRRGRSALDAVGACRASVLEIRLGG